MATLPLIRDTEPGLYAALPTANTGVAVPIPQNATGCVLWFEKDGQIVGGRVGMDEANTAVTGITGTDNNLGYHPPMPVEYTFRSPIGSVRDGTWTKTQRDAFVHVACATAGAVARGMWLFGGTA